MTESTQITSIYAKVEDKSLAQNLKEFIAAADQTKLSSQFVEYLKSYKTDQLNVNNIEHAPQIIANAAMLFRFQVEVIEILSSDSNAEKQDIINTLFGKDSDYEKLYDEYYNNENGLVKRAQAHFKSIPIIPLFAGVIPKSFEAKDQVKLDNLKQTFKEINDVKEIMGVDDRTDTHTIKLLTTHLDKGNTEATMLGLVMSDPRQLGALFAMMGNKTKRGEIDIIQDKSLHISKNTIKGIGKSALRCLFIVAILGAFIAAGYFAAPAIAGFIGLTAAAPAVASAVGSVITSILGFTAIAYIDKKAGEEIKYTYDYQPASINADFGRVGISSDNVTRYTLAPFFKGMMQDKKDAMKQNEFEKRANNIATNIFQNRQVIEKTYGLQDRENLDKITKHMIEELKKFGIDYNNKSGKQK